ncbi:MAG: cytidylate kinase-like family protein [Betaproteobacteria bacterium]|nr:cytidylate kinase-like family protein [Betaproteobacteria bacterium]
MPMIAMTREMGSLGKDVAEGIAARSHKKVVYHEIIEPIANKMRLRKSHVERFLDGKAGIWERLTTDKTSLSIFTADETFRFLRDGSTGVIRGWGAVHLLKEVPHVIRVRVCAPLEIRIDRMMERLGTDDRETVANEINLSEEAHTAITKRHFAVNWRDPENYDIVLSTERLSVEECVDEIENMMARKRFQETQDSVRKVEGLSLAWSVRSALRRDSRTAGVSISITCDEGAVQLLGVVETQAEAAAAAQVAAGVEGVARVDNQLKATSDSRSRYRREG